MAPGLLYAACKPEPAHAAVILIVRIFAASKTAIQAESLTAPLIAAMRTLGPRWSGVAAQGLPECYWKLPELYEHSLQLDSAGLEHVRLLVAMLPGAWTPARIEDALLQTDEDEDLSMVWCRTPGSVFLLPEVQWVEVRLIHAR